MMKPEEQRIAIATYLNRKILPTHKMEGRDENRYFQCDHCGITQDWSAYRKSGKEPEGPCCNSREEWLEDLNAMRELEATLSESLWAIYVEHLLDFVPEETCDLNPNSAQFCIAHSTASQRAESFLKTIGKWKD